MWSVQISQNQQWKKMITSNTSESFIHVFGDKFSMVRTPRCTRDIGANIDKGHKAIKPEIISIIYPSWDLWYLAMAL